MIIVFIIAFRLIMYSFPKHFKPQNSHNYNLKIYVKKTKY